MEVQESTHTLVTRIPRQMPDDGDSEAFKDIIGVLKHIAKFLAVLVFLNVFGSLLLGMPGMSIFLVWVTSYQLLVHYPLMAVSVPGNVMAFLKIVFAIPTFDYIPDGWLENMYTYDDKQHEVHGDILDQARDLHYKNHNALTNGSTIFILLFLYHVKALITFLVCKPLSMSKYNKLKYYKERSVNVGKMYDSSYS